MLSVEKHPPPDPPSQLKHNHPKTDHHERASPILPSPDVDLSNPPLIHHHHQHPLPNFSIRDYVFTSRSKDIKTNWPFSLKNLQLCLKHGVKDVLPPFQPLDAVRNQTFRRCTVENENIIGNNNNNNIIIDGGPSGPDDHDDAEVLNSFHNTEQLNQKLAVDACIDTITSCRSGETDFPSTTTSVCQSEIEDHSVPTNRSTSSPLQTDTSLEASVEVEPEPQPEPEPEPEPAGPRLAHNKTQTTNRTSGKKCRLIVKFSSHSDRSSTEDIASNCTNPSETMTSQICPVCKTFSSSSNTTLNAHIDQCLSVESSTPKWTVDSKLTRHRIKPRKTKLMVDIYATAAHCTLEDLDRRNGSNWATVSNFSIQQSDKSEMPVEDAKQRVSPGPSDHHTSADVGAVYIDANGIKLRILSKSGDAPSVPKVIEHLRPRKPLKGGKGSKFVSARKKKRRAYRYNKYLKLAQSKKLLSTKSRSSPILGGQGKQYGAEGSLEEGYNMQKQLSPSNGNSGTLRQWVCSKRTGVAKKFNNKVSHQQVECRQPVSEDSRVGSDQSRLDQNAEEELMDLSGNPDSSPENSDRSEKVFYEANTCQSGEQSPGIKRAKSSLSGATIRGNVERSLAPMKQNTRQLRKDRSSVNDYHMLKSTKTSTPAPAPIDNYEPPPGICTKLSRSCHPSRSKAMKISSTRKNMLSSRREPVTESKSDAADKFSALNKSQAHLMREIDEEVVPWDSEADQPYDFHHSFSANQFGREDIDNETSLCRRSELEVRKNTGVLGIAGRKEVMVSKGTQMPSHGYLHDEVENMDSSLDKVDDVGPTREDLRCSMDGIVPQQSCKRPARETLASWHKSADPELHKLGNRSKILSNSLQYKGPLCDVEVLTGSPGPSFVGGQETFYSDQLGNGMLVQNVNIGEEREAEDGQGSCFPEVDPILIPGPPGSFLPSPRDMGSEDFQGNSSLTTSRVQSSQDQHDFIDGDSSDSPASATSTISNSTASRDDHKRSEPLPPVGPQVVQDKIRSSLSGGSVDSSIENASGVPQTTNTAAERLTFEREKFKVNNKIPLSFKSDDEPCCCQRKERASQGVLLNYQESQLLRRRAMTSAIMEKQTSCNLNNRPDNVESRSDIFFPSCKSEQVVLPVINSSASQNILRGSADAVAKFSGRSDCDSMSPSSNSILRLMGKNLMVVNRDQDESIPLGQAQPQSQVNHLTSPFSTFSGLSSSNVRNQVYHPFHANILRGSVSLGQDPHNAERQCVEARVSNNMRNHTDPRTSQMLSQGAACSFSNQCMDSGFMAAMELREFKADYSVATTPQKRFKTGPNPAGHMERVMPDHQHKNVLSAANPIKEIITIDDVPETEADLAGDAAKYSRGLGENHVVSSGIVIPSYNTQRAIPFYGCESSHDESLPESQLVHSSGFHSLPSRQANTSPVRWSCPSDESGVLQHNPYIAASSSRGHLRSALYNRQSLM